MATPAPKTATEASHQHSVRRGPVISPADASRIFQPFQRLHDRTSHDGSGLGLAIVDSIAAIHGSTIDARPNPGGGLVIDIAFPPPGQPPRRSPEKTAHLTGR
jgi:signal transduction histidine kinase